MFNCCSFSDVDQKMEISFAVLTVSDSCSAGKNVDGSGPAVVDWIKSQSKFKGIVIFQSCVPDEQQIITDALIEICDTIKPNIALTVGGTGFGIRDVTPEATKAILDKEAPGMVIAMVKGSLKKTPMAILSRPACGVRKSTLVVNLPGSIKGSVECMEIILPAITHAVNLIKGNTEAINEVHQPGHHAETHQHHHPHADSHHHQHHHSHRCEDVQKVAYRLRKSPYTALSVQEALNIVLNNAFQLKYESISFKDGLNRVLAEDVFAIDNLPPFPASIKDGYAVIASDGVGVRKVIGESSAGTAPDEVVVTSGYCSRINTGAPVPRGADAIVQVEDTKLLSESDEGKTELEIEVLAEPLAGRDIRLIGSDIAKGDRVLKCGSQLGYSRLGILATVGATQIKVHQLPVVGLLSTGNELVEPSQEPSPGKIRDSNKTVLTAILKEHGYPSVDLGIAEDSMEELASKLRTGFQLADVIVTTGGVSMGDKDFMKPVLDKYFKATLHFGRVLMKPGLPTTFATVTYEQRTKLVFGLPGNPVSAAVTSNLFLIPALRKMSGHPQFILPIIKVKIGSDIELDPRPEYQRVELCQDPDDYMLSATVTGNQISCRLVSMNNANGLLVLPSRTDEKPRLSKGEIVDCMIIGRL